MMQRRVAVYFGLLAAVFAAKLLIVNSALATEGLPVRRADVPATIAVLMLLLVPLLWIRPPARIPALLGVNALVTALLLADRVHVRFFGDVLSAAEVAHAGQVMAVTSGVARRIAAADAVLFLDVAIGITVWARWRRHVATLDDWGKGRRVAALSMLLMACALGIVPIRLIQLDPEETFRYSTRRRHASTALGVLPYHLYDLTLHIRQLGRRLLVGPDEWQRVRQFFDERRSRPRTSSPLFGRAHGRNLILVMAESLTSLPLDLVIGGKEVTPALSRFARTSIHFTNFFDQTHLGTTADAELASLQSLLPLPDAVIATRYAANRFAGLPAILAGRGYDTLSANVMPGDFWNMRQMHRNFGFARSYFRDEFRDGESFGMGLTDEVFFEQIDDRLRSAREPFMAFLITLSNHLPYELPRQYRQLDVGTLEGTTVGRYLQSVHYFDRAFGALIDRVRDSGLLDRSLVVVYGDHRAFWEDTPEIPRLLGFPGGDRYRTWTVERRLPLLIRLPEGEGAAKVEGAASHVDIAPTVLSLLGVSANREVMLGRDLLSDDEPLVVFRDGGVIAGDQLATGPGDDQPSECFHLRSGASIGCERLDAARREARRQMEISDLVVRGDLIGRLR